MLSKITSISAIYIISFIILFAIGFLWREYSIAKKMLSISAARKCLQKKILPFSMIGILIISISILSCISFSEELCPIILCNLLFCALFLTMLIDFLSSKHSSKRRILTNINKQDREKNFSEFIAYIFFAFLIFLILNQSFPLDFFEIYLVSINLYGGVHSLILSFSSLQLVEEGVIYKFRLIKWNDIRAYKSISDSLDRDGNPVFKITLWARPSILHMSSFVQIPINSQAIDSVTQILAERLSGKNI